MQQHISTLKILQKYHILRLHIHSVKLDSNCLRRKGVKEKNDNV